MSKKLKITVTALSDRGLVRNNNEDSAFAGPFLLAMADGMGGHAAGEIASQLMIERMQRLNQDPGDNDMLALLGASARDANSDIARHVEANPETDGMGCTLTAMMFNGQEFGVVHAGDSRGYRLRDGKLEQITKDDTFVQSLVDKGTLDPEDVSSHPQKSLILKAYTGRNVEPSLFTLDAKPGDRLLLCSDGLSDPVTASTIETALGQGSINTAAQTLVELALRSGGPDNVTVVIAEVSAAAPEDGPTGPVYAGAIAGELPDNVRADSSAARAAMLNRTPQVIPATVPSATVPSTTRETMEGNREEAAEEEDPAPAKRSVGWVTVLSILALLIVVVGGGIGARSYIGGNYYVAQAAESRELTVENGVDFSLFGRPLNKTYQHVCLNAEGEMSLKAGDCGDGFQPFTAQDLSPADRQVVDNLEAGSYDKVQSQLVSLSEDVLPACRTTAKSESTTSAKTRPQKSKSAATSDSAAPSSSATASGSATRPGTSTTAAPTTSLESASNFRAEPGINCREVG
ncbi:PP2C family protein-serine/threonine phosphatase [Corynebacterium phocae]|uniref:PP2C family protein-serine/threonine phosphatase n=1 Tax=Corynebacterium phocae TaxID=161895 RepID=UPI000950FA73|nr:protein phosphatase 2C domain-containing protein [Corynebacterium phocae]KAA8720676.1 serine/threonine-protein phosphatase [Corynebacterium phocae]